MVVSERLWMVLDPDTEDELAGPLPLSELMEWLLGYSGAVLLVPA